MTSYLEQRRAELIRTYRDGLLRDVIPFWLKHGLDRAHGGVHTALGRRGELLDTDKSVWFQGRAAWTFANLNNTVEPRPEWLEAALSFTDVYGKAIQEHWHLMKFWWPHNEAIIATLLAHLMTGDAKYAERHRQVHDWAYARFPDKEHGEWYGYLDREGRPTTELKGGMWKGPFHLPRQKLLCWRMLTGAF